MLGLWSRYSSRFHSCCAGCTDDETENAAYWSMFHIPELSSRDHSSRIWALDEQELATMLLRKEVIQPHLPVRLPCYDLVLIASPTFDGSLPEGLGHRLRVLPTFMT